MKMYNLLTYDESIILIDHGRGNGDRVKMNGNKEKMKKNSRTISLRNCKLISSNLDSYEQYNGEPVMRLEKGRRQ